MIRPNDASKPPVPEKKVEAVETSAENLKCELTRQNELKIRHINDDSTTAREAAEALKCLFSEGELAEIKVACGTIQLPDTGGSPWTT